MLLRVYSNRFLCNHTGIVVPRVFPSCWKLLTFDQIQLDAYCAAVWRRFEATFKLRPVIPIFKRNEMTEFPRKPRQPTSIGITMHIQPFTFKVLESFKDVNTIPTSIYYTCSTTDIDHFLFINIASNIYIHTYICIDIPKLFSYIFTLLFSLFEVLFEVCNRQTESIW